MSYEIFYLNKKKKKYNQYNLLRQKLTIEKTISS